jgi:hypothetical protein
VSFSQEREETLQPLDPRIMQILYEISLERTTEILQKKIHAKDSISAKTFVMIIDSF